MDTYTEQGRRDALAALAAMTERSQQAQAKFAPGTSQHTLQKNRIAALAIAAALIQRELGEPAPAYTKQQLEKAEAPLASLASKSGKAREKLKAGTWQHTMLGNNLTALHMASRLLAWALAEQEEA